MAYNDNGISNLGIKRHEKLVYERKRRTYTYVMTAMAKAAAMAMKNEEKTDSNERYLVKGVSSEMAP